MGKKKKAFEINFGTLLLIIIGICCIIFAFKNFSKEKTKAENNQNENINSTENITEEQTEEKIYSNNVISLNIGKLSDSWKVVEKQNGSIIFYIQGPIKQNEDGTTDDIRINVYLEKSSMTNDELKTQMLEHSVYSNIEYTKIQLIDDVQWRQFDAENKEQKAKILAIMKDGYMYAIEKPLRKIYPNDDDFYAALKRHTETFNVTPHVSPFLMTLGVAMEEENAKSDTFDTSSINNVKVGLMGPMSGIGDSFFWGTFRVIAAGIGIGLAKSGNILGAVIYFLLYTAIHFITKILGGKYGYKMGTKFLENSEENHLMDKLSMGASILGMTVIGAMIGTMVSLQTTLSLHWQELKQHYNQFSIRFSREFFR